MMIVVSETQCMMVDNDDDDSCEGHNALLLYHYLFSFPAVFFFFWFKSSWLVRWNNGCMFWGASMLVRQMSWFLCF